jgi:hypothetical protein
VQSTGTGLTSNNIYRRTSGGSYPMTPTAKVAPTTSYVDSALGRTSTYCYVVTAVSANGESARSNEACASTR